MRDTIPTILIKGENGMKRCINLSKYDPKKHQLWENKNAVHKEEKEEEKQVVHDEFDREYAKSFLKQKGVKFAKNITNDKLEELYNDEKDK